MTSTAPDRAENRGYRLGLLRAAKEAAKIASAVRCSTDTVREEALVFAFQHAADRFADLAKGTTLSCDDWIAQMGREWAKVIDDDQFLATRHAP